MPLELDIVIARITHYKIIKISVKLCFISCYKESPSIMILTGNATNFGEKEVVREAKIEKHDTMHFTKSIT